MVLARFPDPKERPLLRILALSDGIDNKSKAKPWQVANALLKHRIVLDAILIAEGSKNSELLALVKASKFWTLDFGVGSSWLRGHPQGPETNSGGWLPATSHTQVTRPRRMSLRNCYGFAPDTISQALELCELETLFSLSERPVISELASREC